MSSNSTLFSGKHSWLVPMLLLLFVGALALLLAGGANVSDDYSAAPLSANSNDGIEVVHPGIYEGPPSSEQAISRVTTQGTIRGRVTSALWSIWPSEVVIELIKIETHSKIAQFACLREEPNFIFENVPFGSYRLKLVGDRILAFDIDIKLDAEGPNIFQSMALRTAASISGIVFDTAGSPAVNVQVVSRFQHDLEGFFVTPQIANTDSDGRFTIEGVRPGLHKVFVGAEHSPLSKTETLNISENSPNAFAEFTINKFGMASVFVEVRDSSADRITLYKKMRVSAERLNSDPTFRLSLDVNENGIAQFNALPPGRYSFTAYGGGVRRTRQTTSVIEGQNSDIKIGVGKL
ncbi:MAG: carboxypeptidase-like regulatory domain-containing protein [Planctomycetota bacterium]|nr:carboxypeptidase-like regulatory domain-containing protein [Planctomycetota bacterium]